MLSGVSEVQPLKKRLSAQDKAEEKSPKGSPISVEQFVEGLGNIFDKFEKSESLTVAFKVSSIECGKEKELHEKYFKLLMENNFKLKEDVLVLCKLCLKEASMGLHLDVTIKVRMVWFNILSVMEQSHIKI